MGPHAHLVVRRGRGRVGYNAEGSVVEIWVEAEPEDRTGAVDDGCNNRSGGDYCGGDFSAAQRGNKTGDRRVRDGAHSQHDREIGSPRGDSGSNSPIAAAAQQQSLSVCFYKQSQQQQKQQQ